MAALFHRCMRNEADSRYLCCEYDSLLDEEGLIGVRHLYSHELEFLYC